MNDITNSLKNDIKSSFIQEEMKSSYLDYAMSVIVGRALPDFRDGLKPVHRRILYSMYDLNNSYTRPFMKSARIVGDVIGKYHPHGDSAVYNSLVRMAQDFSMRYPLVDGQGNFGSIDGDNAAAMRYTEVRMQKITDELLQDLEKETVDWVPNYDGSLMEPKVFPAKIPNLLVNGSTGIAVGMATNIPPHNLTEIMDGLITLIENPTIDNMELLSYVKGPDFPTGGTIIGKQGVIEAYKTGKGIIQVRAKAHIEHVEKGDRERIIITELPFQVIKANLIEKIAELVNEKLITGISDLRDESSHLGMRVVIDLKRGEIGSVILNRLYKQTQMQISYGIIFLGLAENRPVVLTLKGMLQAFIEHRRDIIYKSTQFDLRKAKDKAHILLGLKIALESIDQIIELIKKSGSPQVAREQLIADYALSEKQANAILDMKLQKITGLESGKIIQDYHETIVLIDQLEAILDSRERMDQIIKEEFIHIREQFGDERKTEIEALDDEISIEDLIKQEDVIVLITQKGYIKRLSIDTYKSQRRGGKGVKGGDVLEDDFYTKIFKANTHSYILFFTNKGTVFSVKVYSIPEAQRTSKGRNMANIIRLPQGETVKEIIALENNERENTEKYLVIVTKSGLIKKSFLSDYRNIKQSGLKAIKIVEDDEIVSVKVVNPETDFLLCASSGKVIRFSDSDCRPLGRVSQGVRGIALEDHEFLIGMETLAPQDEREVLSVTENGQGKRTPAVDYRSQSRGGKGILTMKLNEKTGHIVQILAVSNEDDLLIVTDKGQVIRIKMNEISVLGRNTQGVRLINLKENEKVVAVEKLAKQSDDVEEHLDLEEEQLEDQEK